MAARAIDQYQVWWGIFYKSAIKSGAIMLPLAVLWEYQPIMMIR